MTCTGSGIKVAKKDCINVRSKDAGWHNYGTTREGWRTTCPDCGKLCAVGPTSHTIQKHAKPKLSAVDWKIKRRKNLDCLYTIVYEDGLAGISRRPANTSDREEREIWVMAYLDGLSDGGHNMKAGAFKRWLAKN